MRSDRPRPERRTVRSTFGLEALEPRLLLSADAVGTAVLALLPPDPHDAALAEAYAGSTALAPAGITPFSDPATVLSTDFSDANVNFVNSVRVVGNVTVTATAGNASIGNDSTDYVGGNSAATTDRLTVLAPAGDVRFRGAIGDGTAGTDPLAALTVIAFDDVTFDREVTLDGPLSITAGGVVSFNGGVTLREGGSLSITGATQVFFGPGSRLTLATGSAATPGNLLIEADEIDLRMGEELIVGSGGVTLRPASVGQAVALLNPAGVSDTPTTLSLDRTEMAAFADGFAQFTVGRADGTGLVSVGANPNVDGTALPGPLTVLGGRIDVADYSSRDAILRLGPGDTLRLQATGDIRIANEIEADRIELATSGGRVLSLDVATDGRSSEALRALVLDIDAATGVSLARVEVQQLDVVNSGAGDIAVTVGAARTTTRFDAAVIDGSVTVTGLEQTDAGATAAARIATTAGSLVLDGRGASIAGGGPLTLEALGSGSDLRVQAPISVAGGAVLLRAADALSSTAAGSVTASGAAPITLEAGAGGLVLGAAVTTAGGAVSFTSGGALDLSGVTLDAGSGGRIALTSTGDLTVGVVAASSAIELRSTAGAIRDGWAGDDANLRGEAASVTLNAATGIGAAGTPLRSSVGTLVADAGSGALLLAEATALAIGSAGLRAGGDLAVTTAAGALDVQGAVQAGSDALLQAGGTGGTLTIGAEVRAVAGHLSLVAAQALLVPAPAAVALRTAAAGQGVDIRAGGDASFGANAQVLTSNGPVRIDAGGTLTLGRVDAGTGTASLRGATGIATAAGAPTQPDISAAALRLDGGSGGIALAGDALRVATARLALAAGGGAFVSVADAGSSGFEIGRVDGLVVQRVAADGSTAAGPADAALAGLTAGGPAVLALAGGELRVAQPVAAGGALRLQAPGALSLAASITAAGSATLLAAGALTATAAGDLAAATLDIEAGGDVIAADGTRWASTGAARVLGGGVLALGQVEAGGSLSLRAPGALTAVFSGSGAELRGTTLRLEAASLGSAADPLRLAADTLAARSTTGGLFATEADGLALASLDALALPARVGSDGVAAVRSEAEATLAGLASAAALQLRAAGSVQGTVATPVSAATALTLAAEGPAADLSLAAPLSSSAGALTLSAGRDLLIEADATATGGAQLQAGRDLTLRGGVVTGAVDSRLQAGGDIALGAVDTRGATLTLQAGGALRDGDTALDLQAAALSITAGGAVGAAGDALAFDAATLTLAAGGGAWLAGAGAVALASASVGGALQLSAAGDLAVNGRVDSVGLELRSDGRLDLAAAAQLASGGGAARLQATSALTMADGSALASGGGDVTLAAGGVLTVSRVDAGAGALAITAAALRDIVADADPAADLTAASLNATLATPSGGGFGTPADAIETAVGRLTLDVSGGGIAIAQRGAVVIDGLASGAALLLQASGSISGAGAVSAAGALRLVADGDAASLRLSGRIAVADGAATLRAGADLELTEVALAGATRSLDLEAGGRLVLAQGGSLLTNNGAVLARAGGELVLESVQAGTGAVALRAARISDGDADGDAEVDVIAGVLQLAATDAIGAAANALETRATTLSAAAGAGGLWLAEADALTIGATAVAVQRVAADGSSARLDAPSQEDLVVAEGGTLALVLRSGDLRLGGGSATPASALVAGSGPVLLQAEGGRVFVDSGLFGAGPLSLRALGDLAFAAAGRVQLSGDASADLASGANLLMADGSVVVSAGGSLRLQATGSLTLGELVAGGDVSLLARSIADSGGSEVDVRAQSLRLVATGGGAGTGAAPLQTTVDRLAATVAGTGAAGLFVQETDALRIDRVGPVTVQRVAADGTRAALTDAALADIESAGNVVLRSGGALSVADGDADGLGIASTGNLLLDAGGGPTVAGVYLESGAALRVSAGHATLRATGEVQLAADIALARAGRTLDIEAGGRVAQLAGAGIDTTNGALRIAAGGDITVARVGAGNGDVSLVAGGAITEATDSTGTGDDAPEVAATGLRLVSGAGIGTEAERLELRVGAISARAGDALWLDEADGIRVADVAVRVNRVGADGTTTAVDDAAQSDLVTTGGAGTVALLTRAGDIDLTDGSAPADGRAVTAFGGARVWLQPGGAGAVLDVPGASALQQAGAFVLDSGLRLGGAFVLQAGVGGAAGDGDIVIGGAIDGTAGGAADVLELRSDGGDVTLRGVIGGAQIVDRVLVAGASDVRFAEAVRVSGELRVEASGVVRFDGPVELTGGSLVIRGASQVIVGNVVLGTGDVEITADSIVALGTVGSGGSAARLVLQSAGEGVGVRVGSGPAAGGALLLDAALLARFTGFEQVRVAAPAGDLAVQGELLAAMAPARGVELAASGDIDLTGVLALATPGATAALQAGDAVRMAAGSGLSTARGDVSVAATGDLVVSRIDTRSGDTGATLTLQAGGTLREQGSDAAADVYADRLVLRGLGPQLGAGQSEAGATLDAVAARVDVDQAGGTVLRDSGADGRTRFNVLVGERLYQAVAVAGAPAREASGALPADAVGALSAATLATAGAGWLPLAALRLDAAPWGGIGRTAPADEAPGRATLDYLRVMTGGTAESSLPVLADRAHAAAALSATAAAHPPPVPAAQWWPEPALQF